MPKEYGREQRVGDFIQRELATIIQKEMKDPRVGMASVNEVRVSSDLGYADVYVSSLEARGETGRAELIAVLEGAAGWLRGVIGRRAKMRTIPRLRFHWDDLPERGGRLERLIQHAVADDAARRRDDRPGRVEDANARCEGRRGREDEED